MLVDRWSMDFLLNFHFQIFLWMDYLFPLAVKRREKTWKEPFGVFHFTFTKIFPPLKYHNYFIWYQGIARIIFGETSVHESPSSLLNRNLMLTLIIRYFIYCGKHSHESDIVVAKFVNLWHGEFVNKIHESWSSIGLVINGNSPVLNQMINYFECSANAVF